MCKFVYDCVICIYMRYSFIKILEKLFMLKIVRNNNFCKYYLLYMINYLLGMLMLKYGGYICYIF